MRIIGIDPGTANCGFAVLDVDGGRNAIVDIGTFRSKPNELIRNRVEELSLDLARLVAEHRPTCIVAESPHGSKQARVAAMLWAAYGALLGVAYSRGIFVASRTPDEWRSMLKLSARGKLSETQRKREIRVLVHRLFPRVDDALADVPGDARQHAYDALAISCTWVESAAESAREATR